MLRFTTNIDCSKQYISAAIVCGDSRSRFHFLLFFIDKKAIAMRPQRSGSFHFDTSSFCMGFFRFCFFHFINAAYELNIKCAPLTRRGLSGIFFNLFFSLHSLFSFSVFFQKTFCCVSFFIAVVVCCCISLHI